MGVQYQLYTDSSVFQREYPADAKLSDIMSAEGIPGRARIKVDVGDRKDYRVDGSGFEFSIKQVH